MTGRRLVGAGAQFANGPPPRPAGPSSRQPAAASSSVADSARSHPATAGNAPAAATTLRAALTDENAAPDAAGDDLDRANSFESSSWVAIPSRRSDSSLSSYSLSEEVDSDLNALGVTALRYRHRTRRRGRWSEPADFSADDAHHRLGLDLTRSTVLPSVPSSIHPSPSPSSSPDQLSPARLSARHSATSSLSDHFHLPLPQAGPDLDLRPPRISLESSGLSPLRPGSSEAGSDDGHIDGPDDSHIEQLYVPGTRPPASSAADTDLDTDVDRETETDGETEAVIRPSWRRSIPLSRSDQDLFDNDLLMPGVSFFSSHSNENHHSRPAGHPARSLLLGDSTSPSPAPSGSPTPHSSFGRQISQRRQAAQAERSEHMLRQSLTTLLSCAAATRSYGSSPSASYAAGTSSGPRAAPVQQQHSDGPSSRPHAKQPGPPSSMHNQLSAPAPARNRNSTPVSIRMITEAAVLGQTSARPDEQSDTDFSISAYFRPTGRSHLQGNAGLSSESSSSKSRQRSSSPSSEAAAAAAAAAAAPPGSLPLGIPRYALPYIISLSALIAVGALSFTAGYFLGRVPGSGGPSGPMPRGASRAAAGGGGGGGSVGGSAPGLLSPGDLLDDFFFGWQRRPEELARRIGANVVEGVNELVESIAAGVPALPSLGLDAAWNNAVSGLGSLAAVAGSSAPSSSPFAAAGGGGGGGGGELESHRAGPLAGMSGVEKALVVGGLVGGAVAGKGLLSDW